MASLDKEGWELDSAEALNERYPDSFLIPCRDDRQSLKMGQMVKLLFLLLDHENGEAIVQGERMWVTITQISGHRCIGQLESEPATPNILQPLDLIEFGPEHVAAIFVDQPN